MVDLTINECLRDYHNGDMLVDKDLARLFAHMDTTALLLAELGAEYKFAWIDARRIAESLQHYMEASGVDSPSRLQHMRMVSNSYRAFISGV